LIIVVGGMTLGI